MVTTSHDVFRRDTMTIAWDDFIPDPLYQKAQRSIIASTSRLRLDAPTKTALHERLMTMCLSDEYTRRAHLWLCLRPWTTTVGMTVSNDDPISALVDGNIIHVPPSPMPSGRYGAGPAWLWFYLGSTNDAFVDIGSRNGHPFTYYIYATLPTIATSWILLHSDDNHANYKAKDTTSLLIVGEWNTNLHNKSLQGALYLPNIAYLKHKGVQGRDMSISTYSYTRPMHIEDGVTA